MSKEKNLKRKDGLNIEKKMNLLMIGMLHGFSVRVKFEC